METTERRGQNAPDGAARAKTVLEASGFGPRAARISRFFDFIIVFAAVCLFTGAIHLHVMLSVGDWDMFLDWKDRQYWPLLTPVVMIMFPAAIQATFWSLFRLPIGATVGGVCLMLAVSITRPVQFHLWTSYPLNLVLPATMLAGCLWMDVMILLFRNFLFTAVFGGFAFAVLFYFSNYTIFAPFHLPVSHQGMMASVADMIGYVYPRSATPEYIRIIERGTLRTFGDSVGIVSAFFSGFICIFMYALWWKFGMAMSSASFLKNAAWVQRMMGLRVDGSAEVRAQPTAGVQGALPVSVAR